MYKAGVGAVSCNRRYSVCEDNTSHATDNSKLHHQNHIHETKEKLLRFSQNKHTFAEQVSEMNTGNHLVPKHN